MAACLTLAGWQALATLDPASLQRQLIANFGPARVTLLKDWLQIVNSAKAQGEQAKLTQINNFINRNIVFENDFGIWQQTDYWATPLETIGQGRGDCEDFAIIKYVSLRMAGIPSSKLRLIYVKAKQNSRAQTARYSKQTWCWPIMLRRARNPWYSTI